MTHLTCCAGCFFVAALYLLLGLPGGEPYAAAGIVILAFSE